MDRKRNAGHKHHLNRNIRAFNYQVPAAKPSVPSKQAVQKDLQTPDVFVQYLSGLGTPLWHHYTVDFILFKSRGNKARACSKLDEKIKSALLCSFNHAEGCSIATGSESQDEGSQFPPCRFTAQLLGALRIQLPQQHKLR